MPPYFFSLSLIPRLLHRSLSSLVVLLLLIAPVSDISSLGSDVDDLGLAILPPNLALGTGAAESGRRGVFRSKWWSNFILHRKLKYCICCLRDVMLKNRKRSLKQL